MTDQQKASACSLHGNHLVATPTWERLAAEGVAFLNAYAQSPICTPSRASMMTGTYPLVHRVLCHQNHAPSNLRQLPEFLAAAGYHCIGAGHYESQRSLTRGWHQTIEMTGTPALQDALRAVQMSGSRRVGWSAGETALGPEQSHAAVLNDELFQRLDAIDPDAAPLFVHVAYIEPHAPYFAPRGYLDRSVLRNAPLPEIGNLAERPAWHERMLADYGSAEATPEDIRLMLAAYYGTIRYVDEQIGRLLAYLERRGLAENSWIILTSDHGDYAGEKGFYTKSESTYECLLHVPLVIRGPKGRWHSGKRVGDLTELIDLFSTILSVAGVETPPQAQGHDLVRWINQGARRPLREATFAAVGEYHGPLKTTMPHGLPESGRRKGLVRSARGRTHLLIRDPDTGDEAYDVISDPGELRNLLPAGRSSTQIQRLGALLESWEDECRKLSHALGVQSGPRNFDEPVGALTGQADWKRPSPFPSE